MSRAKGYCIKGPDGELNESTVRYAQIDCWDDFAEQECMSKAGLENRGYTCVPVEIKEIEE